MPEYRLNYAEATVPCPKCGRGDCYWENVDFPGWRSIEYTVHEDSISGKAFSGVGSSRSFDWDIDYEDATPTGEIGCSQCGWEGRESDLEADVPFLIGWDGKKIPVPMEGQGAFDV